jgi:hypothetical protein
VNILLPSVSESNERNSSGEKKEKKNNNNKKRERERERERERGRRRRVRIEISEQMIYRIQTNVWNDTWQNFEINLKSISALQTKLQTKIN